MVKNREINGTEDIGSVTPTTEQSNQWVITVTSHKREVFSNHRQLGCVFNS